MDWKEYFVVDSVAGAVYWKERDRSSFKDKRYWNIHLLKRAGRLAGYTHRGYRLVYMMGRGHFVHRIIWEMVNGPIPQGLEIDHIDGNPSNNTIGNLRLATRSQQLQNTRTRSDSSHRLRGVSLDKRDGAWDSCITINKTKIYLGRYPNKLLAYDAYIKAAIEHFGEFARL